MKYLIYISLFLVSTGSVRAQFYDKYTSQWDVEVLQEANTAKDVKYLSTQEKLIIYYTNLARMNPSLFADTYLKEFAERNNEKMNLGYLKLIKELRSSEPLPPLQPSEELWKVAKEHARDMGEAGKKGHRNTNGEFYRERTAELRNQYTEIHENIHYGFNEAIDIVGDLLLDNGYRTKVHRETILNPKLAYIGPAINAHTEYRFNSVIEYSGAAYDTTLTE